MRAPATGTQRTGASSTRGVPNGIASSAPPPPAANQRPSTLHWSSLTGPSKPTQSDASFPDHAPPSPREKTRTRLSRHPAARWSPQGETATQSTAPAPICSGGGAAAPSQLTPPYAPIASAQLDVLPKCSAARLLPVLPASAAAAVAAAPSSSLAI
eukprot:6169810-Prymnesium_polylepis.2